MEKYACRDRRPRRSEKTYDKRTNIVLREVGELLDVLECTSGRFMIERTVEDAGPYKIS